MSKKTAVTSQMLLRSHPVVQQILVGRDLIATDAEMEKNIGRDVMLKWTPTMGANARDHSFRIIGIQRDYTGALAYRVLRNDGIDQFGSVALPDEVEFVEAGK